MNLLLVEPHEVGDGGRVLLEGRRAEHLRKVLKVAPGDRVRAGVVASEASAGRRGMARVVAVAPGRAELVLEDLVFEDRMLEGEASADRRTRPAVDLIVGMPRPQVLHRVLQTASTMGVRRLDLVAAWRVEKSFFQSPSATPRQIRRQLLLGAEQGLRTRLPSVALHHRFVSFVEGLSAAAVLALEPLDLLAHVGAERAIEDVVSGRVAGVTDRPVRLAIGPEGGWIDREVETFRTAGFEPVDLGPWVLRVEFAVAAALAQIDLLRRSVGRAEVAPC